jgi:hypothetical protein
MYPFFSSLPTNGSGIALSPPKSLSPTKNHTDPALPCQWHVRSNRPKDFSVGEGIVASLDIPSLSYLQYFSHFNTPLTAESHASIRYFTIIHNNPQFSVPHIASRHRSHLFHFKKPLFQLLRSFQSQVLNTSVPCSPVSAPTSSSPLGARLASNTYSK